MEPFTKPELPMSEPSSPDQSNAPVQLGPDDKYIVDIFVPPKAIPSPKESLEAIKGGVKGKMLARMKKEAVDCPVKLKKVSFVECFTCPNFNARLRGKVRCKGLPLPAQPG
jgi:hypothetical protein